MQHEGTPPVEVRYTSEFKRNIRRLLKRYRRIRGDISAGVVRRIIAEYEHPE